MVASGAKNTEILRENSDEEEAVCGSHVMRVLMNLSPKRTPALVSFAYTIREVEKETQLGRAALWIPAPTTTPRPSRASGNPSRFNRVSKRISRERLRWAPYQQSLHVHRACLVRKKFQDFPSHRILRHIHGVLNLDENKN